MKNGEVPRYTTPKQTLENVVFNSSSVLACGQSFQVRALKDGVAHTSNDY